MLHIISRSLFQSHSAEAGVALVNDEDAVLLLGDGVYGAAHALIRSVQNVYAIEEDRLTRGLPREPGVQYIDYEGMVRLTDTQSPAVTWN